LPGSHFSLLSAGMLPLSSSCLGLCPGLWGSLPGWQWGLHRGLCRGSPHFSLLPLPARSRSRPARPPPELPQRCPATLPGSHFSLLSAGMLPLSSSCLGLCPGLWGSLPGWQWGLHRGLCRDSPHFSLLLPPATAPLHWRPLRQWRTAALPRPPKLPPPQQPAWYPAGLPPFFAALMAGTPPWSSSRSPWARRSELGASPGAQAAPWTLEVSSFPCRPSWTADDFSWALGRPKAPGASLAAPPPAAPGGPPLRQTSVRCATAAT